MDKPFITVVEFPAFTRRAEKLLAEGERNELISALAAYPDAGDEIPGTGGVRKVRFAARGKGKSGGVRVIYYYFDMANPLFAIFIYGKGEQVDLTPDQKRIVTGIAAKAKALAQSKRRV
jgi:hypothetical protein